MAGRDSYELVMRDSYDLVILFFFIRLISFWRLVASAVGSPKSAETKGALQLSVSVACRCRWQRVDGMVNRMVRQAGRERHPGRLVLTYPVSIVRYPERKTFIGAYWALCWCIQYLVLTLLVSAEYSIGACSMWTEYSEYSIGACSMWTEYSEYSIGASTVVRHAYCIGASGM